MFRYCLSLCIFIVCAFSSVGCYTSKLTEADKAWLIELTKPDPLEKDNAELKNGVAQLEKDKAELKNSNSELTKEIEMLKGSVDQLTQKVEELKNGNNPRPSIFLTPNRILRVGDKFPSFNDNEINLEYLITRNEPTIVNPDGTVTKKNVMKWRRGSVIELKNRTRYICANPDGCEIVDLVITKGSIEVYYNKA